MKAKILSVFVLPLPAYTFTTTSGIPTTASAKPRGLFPCLRSHVQAPHAYSRPTSISSRRRSPWPSASAALLTAHTFNLPKAVGSGEMFPPAPPAQQQGAPAAATAPAFDRSNLGLHLKIGSRVMNMYGLLFATQAWLTALLMFPLCLAAALVAPLFDWQRMRPPTLVAILWGRLSLWNMGVQPQVEGAELLPPREEAVVFVANHGSYLDIPVTNFLPRMCKYLMKAELLWLPIVGWKAVLARDIFVHRQTQSSFRRLLKSTTRSLKAGNSIMTFPEGTRSRDGRLGQFKRGPFTMAQRAGVRVVPLTITGVTDAMPPFAMAPLRKPRNVRLIVHPPIPTKGRPMNELIAEARKAVGDRLEDWQKPDADESFSSSSSSPPPPQSPPSQ